MSNPKSDIDWMILDAKTKPAPGSYDIKLPASCKAEVESLPSLGSQQIQRYRNLPKASIELKT